VTTDTCDVCDARVGSGTRVIFDTIDDDNEFVAEAGDDYKVKYFDILDLKVKFEVVTSYSLCLPGLVSSVSWQE
jgi:hypothetical protein